MVEGRGGGTSLECWKKVRCISEATFDVKEKEVFIMMFQVQLVGTGSSFSFNPVCSLH